MMRAGKIYVPCFRWKQGEYQALLKLPPSTRDLLLPIFDVAEFFADDPEGSFDHEDGKPAKTIDKHLSKFAKRVREKWGTDECFVDLRHVEPTSRMKDGQHPAKFVFDDLRAHSVEAIPVIGINRDASYRASVIETVSIDKRGACLRSNLEEVAGDRFIEKLNQLIQELKLAPYQCDFVLDLGMPDSFEPLQDFANLLRTVIAELPYLTQWRAFGIIAHSLPVSVNKLPQGISILPRNEWLLYKRLVQDLGNAGIRVPTYGDYAINHPAAMHLNMRFIYPKAAVKYTVLDKWFISRGEQIRGKNGIGLQQYSDLCDAVVESAYYCGPAFSWGDDYLLKCAKKQIKPGGQSRFREVGTSHHIEMVIHDLSTLGAS